MTFTAAEVTSMNKQNRHVTLVGGQNRYLVTLVVAIRALDEHEAARIAASHHERHGYATRVESVTYNESDLKL